ncbi:hypothetical protein V6N13_056973 [Hibiscus sabdariffa]|uniref:Uncharacterized protein n=2 Tax=Hibiscus sabdariffa TaxID=183260 RepID=A0ABR2D5A7_9ROSI
MVKSFLNLEEKLDNVPADQKKNEKKIELVCANQKALDYLNVNANSTTVRKALEKVEFSHLRTSTRCINVGLNFTGGFPKTDLISGKHGIVISKVIGPYALSDLSIKKKLSNKNDVGSGIEIDNFMGEWMVDTSHEMDLSDSRKKNIVLNQALTSLAQKIKFY